MFRVLRKASELHHHSITSTDLKPTIHALGFLLNPHTTPVRSISTPVRSISTPSSSTTLDFLVNSCGLDPKVALLSSKKIILRTTEKPDLVLDILRKYGITNTQINQIVSKTPAILKCDPIKTLEPKIEFLHGLGISGSGIVDVLSRDSTFLWRSLEETIIPSVTFLKRRVSNPEEFLQALKNSTRHFSIRFEGLVGQNSETLRDYGVEERNIMQILVFFPGSLVVPNDRFTEIVEQVKEMGFDPSSTLFGYAVRTMAAMAESRWKEKWEAYRKLGFSEEQIVTVFRKQPFCLMSSEEKIRRGVEFFTQKLKWTLEDICMCPLLLRLSFENRIIPRTAVLELLKSKGVIKKKLDVHSLARVFKLSEHDFLQKFVVKYLEAVPEVVNVYKGSIHLERMQEEDGLKELN